MIVDFTRTRRPRYWHVRIGRALVTSYHRPPDGAPRIDPATTVFTTYDDDTQAVICTEHFGGYAIRAARSGVVVTWLGASPMLSPRVRFRVWRHRNDPPQAASMHNGTADAHPACRAQLDPEQLAE